VVVQPIHTPRRQITNNKPISDFLPKILGFIISLPFDEIIQNSYHSGRRKARGNKKGPYERAMTYDHRSF
jgi:hypothetical protein